MGRYDAVTNIVYYIAEIANRQLQEDGVTEWHEIWHMRQAENFRKEVGKITAENYVKYIAGV